MLSMSDFGAFSALESGLANTGVMDAVVVGIQDKDAICLICGNIYGLLLF